MKSYKKLLEEVAEAAGETLEEARKRKQKKNKRKAQQKRKQKKSQRRKKRKAKKKPKSTGFKIDSKRATKVNKSIKPKLSPKYEVSDRKMALAEFLDIKDNYDEDDYDSVEEFVDNEVEDGYDEGHYDADGGEYMVLTDDEADDRLNDYISETIWAFNTNFLSYHIEAEAVTDYIGAELEYEGDPDDEDDEGYTMEPDDYLDDFHGGLEGWIKEQQERYEDGNDTLKAVITDFKRFVREAEMSDGRGHFLSSYDGNEEEEGNFYIYRTN